MSTVQITGGYNPPDIEYFLDGSIECFDITPDIYLWGKFFKEGFTQLLDHLENEPNEYENHSDRLNFFGQRLEEEFLKWQETADPNAVALCLAYGATYSTNVESIINGLVGQIVEYKDPTFPAFRLAKVCYETKDLIYYDGLAYVERKISYFKSRQRMLKQWEEIKDTVDWASLRIEWPQPKRIKFRVDGELEEEWVDFDSYRPKPKPIKKEQKKALKRSAELLNNLTGENTVSLFLSGQSVEVTGNKYRFELTKQQFGSITGSHGSANTRVYDIATGEFVCGLCVYTENVTVFDHLASLVLHCKAGLEEQIIQDANITTHGNLELLPKDKRDDVYKASRNFEDLFGNRGNIEETFAKRKALSESNKLKQKMIKRFKKKYPELSLTTQSKIVGLSEMLFERETTPLMISG